MDTLINLPDDIQKETKDYIFGSSCDLKCCNESCNSRSSLKYYLDGSTSTISYDLDEVHCESCGVFHLACPECTDQFPVAVDLSTLDKQEKWCIDLNEWYERREQHGVPVISDDYGWCVKVDHDIVTRYNMHFLTLIGYEGNSQRNFEYIHFERPNRKPTDQEMYDFDTPPIILPKPVESSLTEEYIPCYLGDLGIKYITSDTLEYVPPNRLDTWYQDMQILKSLGYTPEYDETIELDLEDRGRMQYRTWWYCESCKKVYTTSAN